MAFQEYPSPSVPELDFAILCQSATIAGTALFIQAGAIDTFQGPAGGVALFTLAMRLLFTSNEVERTHRVEVILQGEDGERLGNAGGDVQVVRGDLPPGWRSRILVTLHLPIPMPRYGTYSIEILINDSAVKSLPLRLLPPDG